MSHVHASAAPSKRAAARPRRTPTLRAVAPVKVDAPELSHAAVLDALGALKGAFIAADGDGYLRVEHNDVHASANHRDEQLHDATVLLRRAGYQVWPEGWCLEVSLADGEVF